MENDYEIVDDGKGHRVQQPDYEVAVIARDRDGWYCRAKSFSAAPICCRIAS